MTPNELKAARTALCLSQAELAALCHVQSDRTVRKWEAGERDIPGPVIVLLALFKAHPAALKTAMHLKTNGPTG